MPLIEEANAKEKNATIKVEEANSSLKKMIQKMLNKGFSMDEIAQDLDKSVAEINELIGR